MTTRSTRTNAQPVHPAVADLAMAKIADHADVLPHWKVLLRHGELRLHARTRTSRGPLGHCYTNALTVAIGDEGARSDLRYTEGLAFDPRFGMLYEHAWHEDAEGLVHEPTWPDTREIVYLGIQFNTAELYDAQRREPGPMIWADYMRDFELLRTHERCCDLKARRPSSGRPGD